MVTVPNVPGVPSLFRSVVVPIPTLLTSDTLSGFGSNLQPVWGIYQDGQPIIPADTASTFSFRREWAVADYQIEQGGFESYDKVDLPFEPRVQLVCGGSLERREAFLSAIDRIAETLDLIDVVIPETVYSSVNIQHYDFRRTSRNGLGIVMVDIWLIEIRIVGMSGQNVKTSSGSSAVNDGNVNTTAPTDQQNSVPPQVK